MATTPNRNRRKQQSNEAVDWNRVVSEAVRFMSDIRLELFSGLILGAVWGFVALHSTAVVGGAAVGVLITPAAVIGGLRSRVVRLFGAASVRRQIRMAIRAVAIPSFRCRDPRVVAITRTAIGHTARVSVPRGARAGDLIAVAENIAGCLGVSDVRIERDPKNARWVLMTIVRRDPFEGSDPPRWPRV